VPASAPVAVEARISVTIDPADATLSVDGVKLSGRSPFVVPHALAGSVHLRAEREGFTAVDLDLKVDAPALAVPIKLTRAEAPVHRAPPTAHPAVVPAPARDDSPLTPIKPQSNDEMPGKVPVQ
jgi:hypothetical protein